MSERHVGAALLAAAGAINAAPGIGAFSGGRIRSAYGLDDGAGVPTWTCCCATGPCCSS